MKAQVKNYGFKPPVIMPDHYTLGGFTKIRGAVINALGSWRKYLSPPEWQATDSIETQNCSGFGTFNSIESLEFLLTGNQENHSDRALGIAAGTSPYQGNDPHAVAETIRKQTIVVPEEVLPFPVFAKSPEDYYKPKPLTSDIVKQGQPWADKWNLGHEWVFFGGTTAEKRAKLKEALTKGPVSVSVYAWVYDDQKKVYTKNVGQQDTHWCQLVEYDNDGFPIIYDSYGDGKDSNNPFLKKLDALYDFGFAKVYYLTPAEKKRDIIWQILIAIGKILNLDALLIKKQSEPPVIIPPDEEIPPPVIPAPVDQYLWHNRAEVRHSIRVICDEEDLSVQDKNILCACIEQESQFDLQAISSPNKNGTRDWGLCQFNDGKNPQGKPYWIGPGAAFTSTDEVLENPQKCVRIMAREFKRGEPGKRQWVSYSSGAYKKYL